MGSVHCDVGKDDTQDCYDDTAYAKYYGKNSFHRKRHLALRIRKLLRLSVEPGEPLATTAFAAKIDIVIG